MSDLHQFNPGRKSWKMYANTITSISGDDLTISPYDGKDLILEVSANKQIIFKQGDTSYNLADLSNIASGGGSVSLTNYSDASFNNVDISGNVTIHNQFSLPGLQTGASNGDVLTFDGTSITLATPSGGASDVNGLNDGLVVNNSSYFIGSVPISYTSSAVNNTFFGYNSGNTITNGNYNVGVGANSLYSITTGKHNVALGYEAGKLSTSGENNIFIGYQSGINVTTGGYNVAVGTNTLKGISDKWSQTAIGYNCLSNPTLTGNENTGVGTNVLQSNTSGRSNAVLGAYAKMNNTSGHSSVAVGYASARNNTTGYENVFVGFNSCRNGTTGFHNVYIGFDSAYYTNGNYNVNVGTQSGQNNNSATKNTGVGYRSLFGGGGGTGGSENTALGFQSSRSITSGLHNTSVGANSLYSITTGSNNVAVGYQSLNSNTTGYHNVAIGHVAGNNTTTGYKNVYIGYNCYGSSANNDNEIVIGSDVIGSGSDTVTIGANDNIAHYLGKALIGNLGHNSNYAGFSYRGLDSSSYALLQDNNGGTRINAKTGQIIYFFINNNSNNGFTFDGTTLDMNNKIISKVREIKLGSSSDSGTDGSVLISKGVGNPVEWSGSNFNINTSTSTFNCVNLTASQNVNCSDIICSDKIGIGTNSPSEKLHVNGLTFISNPTVPTVGNHITNFKIDGSYDGFGSSFQIQMGRLVSSGSYGAAHAKIMMVGGGLRGMQIGEEDSANAYLDVKAGRSIAYRTPNSASYMGHHFFGYVFNFNGSNVSSDDRLKWEEEDITNGLEVINKLKPQIYWKGKELNVEPNTEERTRESGYIAQEVEDIPELTHIVKQSVNKDMSPGTYFLDYAQIHPYHTSAIQELHKLVKNQENTINELNTKVQSLEYENLLIKSAVNELLSEAGKSTI